MDAHAQSVLGEAGWEQGRADRHRVLCLAEPIPPEPYFQPGIEFYGEIEDINNAGRFNQQQFRIGPMFHGRPSLANIFGTGKLVYEAGYLFGATSETEKGTLRTRLELEIPF